MNAPLQADASDVRQWPLCTGVLTAIGHTPLVRLDNIFPGNHFQLYAKMEMLNPGGSIKDRAALEMILDGCAHGKIGPNTTIIESSSGNLGIGLAQICRFLNLRFICVVDTKATPLNVAILKAFGAEVQVVEKPEAGSDDLLGARLNRVRRLLETIEDSYWLNQYANVANPLAHYRTMKEIDEALGGRLDYLFVATSTCGTLRGCREYVRERGLTAKVIAVDAVGSVIFGQQPGTRLIPGHGASRVPDLFQTGLEDMHLHVTDLDCVVGCRRLLRSEAVLAGGSSGGIVAAVAKLRDEIPAGANCVVVLCDRGERYLETIYSDGWVREHFGDVTHLLD